MFCKLNSYALNGVNTIPVEVEIDLHDGLPGFDIVGLPDSAVREAKERVKSAIKNSGYKFPICHITINLAPADLKKEGSLYDLPIALGILCCMGLLPSKALENKYFIGELALNGAIRMVKGLLPFLCNLTPNDLCVIPELNTAEAALVPNRTIYLASSLKEVIRFVLNELSLPIPSYPDLTTVHSTHEINFDSVKGQDSAKRGLMICASGYHNAILIGSPGSGKTMLSKALATIMPPLTLDESIEITKLYSVANQLPEGTIINQRPFRSPHHTISPTGLVGGGAHPKPGEMSLAHLGILFLDELLEFNRHTLELLRQPLEDHKVTLSRAQRSYTYPANFLFLASTNPCPCGFYPDTNKCTCSLPSIKKYLTKLSGPLIDRIDIHLELHVPTLKELSTPPLFTADFVCKQVLKVQQLQATRYQNYNFNYNSELPAKLIDEFCPLSSQALDILNSWFEQAGASVRSYNKVLRVARTIADLDDQTLIDVPHIAEALQYRLLDRQFWA